MAVFSIKDIENFTGVKAHTLRIWEQRYNFIVPKRTETNIRYYDDEDLRKLLNIAILNRNGVKVSKIASMTEKEITAAVLEHSKTGEQTPDIIDGLTASMLNMDEGMFEKIVSKAVIKAGFDNSILDVLFPFLTRIGVLWSAGSILVAHEHFMTNMIRQKIIAAIDAAIPKMQGNKKKFVLFLYEYEMHELGLLYASYLLRLRGHEVIYLGQNFPTGNLEEVFKFYQPNYIVSSFTTSLDKSFMEDISHKITGYLPEVEIIFSGEQLKRKDLNFSKQVKVVKDIPEFLDLIDMIS